MSGQAAAPAKPQAARSGAVVVRLLHKIKAIEHTLRYCERGLCRPCDVAVVAFIANNMDNATGECTRKYSTIASGCGMGRSTVAEASSGSARPA